MSCSSIEGSEKEEDRDREEEEERFMDLPVRSLATQKINKNRKKDKFRCRSQNNKIQKYRSTEIRENK